ncbi:MAG: carboxymuconolactone decarboxylase family protein [Inquilinaceae bacterium]
MQRIDRIEETSAPQATAGLLAAVKKQMGGVPNIVGTMAQSSAALGGYLGFAGALAGGKLSAALREQIALTVAGANRCDYCASAHTAVGGRLGLAADEITRNLGGHSTDPRVQGALRFAASIVATRGNVSDEDLAAVRRAGFTDEEVVEIVANTVLNIFTNYFNHIARTDIDFPVVSTDALAAA